VNKSAVYGPYAAQWLWNMSALSSSSSSSSSTSFRATQVQKNFRAAVVSLSFAVVTAGDAHCLTTWQRKPVTYWWPSCGRGWRRVTEYRLRPIPAPTAASCGDNSSSNPAPDHSTSSQLQTVRVTKLNGSLLVLISGLGPVFPQQINLSLI